MLRTSLCIAFFIFTAPPVINCAEKDPPSYHLKVFSIAGDCKKVDISSESTKHTEMYYEFEVFRDSENIKSQVFRCPQTAIVDWTRFALREARKHSSVDERAYQYFWKRSFERILSLKPTACGIITNPKSETKLVIMRFKLDAEKNEQIYWRELLSFFQVGESELPRTFLAQFLSNESDSGLRKIVNVKHICDLDRDGRAEVILLDQRYAGHNFWILRFKNSYSAVKKEFVDGMRGD